jgi:hypothetical protein
MLTAAEPGRIRNSRKFIETATKRVPTAAAIRRRM